MSETAKKLSIEILQKRGKASKSIELEKNIQKLVDEFNSIPPVNFTAGIQMNKDNKVEVYLEQDLNIAFK